MRNIAKPTLSTATVYNDCLGVIRDPALRARLAACSPLVLRAEQEFEAKVTKGLIYTIARETTVNGNVTAAELKNVYTAQMVANPVGRLHYDALILAAPLGLCPLCAHRDVSTLDHYLPKAEYPRLAVVPVNLVPACKDCNTGKLSVYPLTPEEETLHPYYDNIEQDHWLAMRVVRSNPVSVEFFVQRPVSWDNLLFDRVNGHFHSFGLKKLYAMQAARELPAIKSQLINVFDSGAGKDGVKKLLNDAAATRYLDNKNAWQTAFYAGLAADDWFCTHGIRQIG